MSGECMGSGGSNWRKALQVFPAFLVCTQWGHGTSSDGEWQEVN